MKTASGTNPKDDWFVCPHCGARVRADAAACPECGSDDSTGWSRDADTWNADIPAGYGPDDEFDYDEYVAREFGDRPETKRSIPPGIIVLLALIGCALLAFWLLSNRS